MNNTTPRLEVMPLQQQIARQLRQRREARGLTQAQLAAKVGSHQATIAKLEAGQGNPTVSH